MPHREERIEEYEAWLAENTRYTDSTIGQYVSAARSYEKFLNGAQPNLDNYKAWLQSLQDEGKAAGTVNGYHSKATKYLEFLGSDFNTDDAEGELPEYDPDKVPEPLTKAEVQAIRDAADGVEDEAIIILLYHTALRNSELRDLRWSDVNYSQNDLTVRRRKKKGWARDTLPLYGDQIDVLERLEDARETENPFLFPARVGYGQDGESKAKIREEGKVSADYIRSRVSELSEKAGIRRRVWPHLFRHTRATHMLQDGASVDYVNQYLDHDSYDTTLRYARLTGATLRNEETADSSAVFE